LGRGLVERTPWDFDDRALDAIADRLSVRLEQGKPKTK
jgi:hypothetical protein